MSSARTASSWGDVSSPKEVHDFDSEFLRRAAIRPYDTKTGLLHRLWRTSPGTLKFLVLGTMGIAADSAALIGWLLVR